MICQPCRDDVHTECAGIRRHRTYCDCQHRPGFLAAIRRQTANMWSMARMFPRC